MPIGKVSFHTPEKAVVQGCPLQEPQLPTHPSECGTAGDNRQAED